MIKKKIKIYTHTIILTLVVFLIFSTSVHAQKTVSYKELDLKSYAFYQQSQWDSLVELGKVAKENDFSSYALDIRIGAAYYHKKRYRKALYYFEKLDLVQSNDVLLFEYRYYAYVFSGRLSDARKLFLDFKNLANKVSFKNDLSFGEVGLESKIYSFDYKKTEENYTSINEQIVQSREYYGFFINFHSLKNLELTLAPMWLNENILSFDSSLEDEKWEKDIFQKHLYLSGKYLLGYGKKIFLNYHHSSSELNSYPIDSDNHYSLVENSVSHLFGLFYQHDFRNVQLTVGSNYSPQDTVLEFLPSASLTYFPFGNDVLYSVSRLNFQNAKSDWKLDPWVMKQTIGVKIGKKIWLEGYGQLGKIQHFYDDFGYIIYDQEEMINSYWGINAKYLIHKNWEVFASFQQYNMKSSFEKDEVSKKEKFTINSGLIGLKWKFYKN